MALRPETLTINVLTIADLVSIAECRILPEELKTEAEQLLYDIVIDAKRERAINKALQAQQAECGITDTQMLDKARLDWLESRRGQVYPVNAHDFACAGEAKKHEVGHSIREAIDAAMQATWQATLHDE